MGKVIDMQSRQTIDDGTKAPEALYPDGAGVNGGLNEQGIAILTLNLVSLNPETQQPEATHTITMLAEAWYQIGGLIQQSAAQLEIASVDFRRQHARRLENEKRQAHGGLILPGNISHQADDISKEDTPDA